jgi:hypothetical protein
VLGIVNFNIHRTVKALDYEAITKLNDKVKNEKNGDRIVEIIAKSLPKMMQLEAISI